MKSVLMSIQPKWCELIANGKKTVEVRKTKPKLETPFKCYIYCTKNTEKRIGHWLNLYCDSKQVTTDIKLEEPCYPLNGKVIGEFICDEISQQNTKFGVYLINYQTTSGLTAQEVCEYGNGKQVYFWKISDLKIYDKPKGLHHFFKPCGNCDKKGTRRCTEELTDCRAKVIERPPQSWCYVKGGAE